MAINLKDIKKNFFDIYLKYWITFFLILFLYFFNLGRKYFFSTNNITMNIAKAIFVTNGIAINERYIIANKSLIESSCIGNLSGLTGEFYIVNNQNIYRAIIERGDSINNMVLLRLKNNEDLLVNYAILQAEPQEYIINKRFLIPISINSPGKFNFKQSRIVGSNNKDFFLAIKNITKNDTLLGTPVFNKNYVLQGIIKSINNNYTAKTKRDEILNKSNIQKVYLVNGIDTIKSFLTRYNIDYYVINGDTNLNKTIYNPQNSVVNIICIKIY